MRWRNRQARIGREIQTVWIDSPGRDGLETARLARFLREPCVLLFRPFVTRALKDQEHPYESP